MKTLGKKSLKSWRRTSTFSNEPKEELSGTYTQASDTYAMIWGIAAFNILENLPLRLANMRIYSLLKLSNLSLNLQTLLRQFHFFAGKDKGGSVNVHNIPYSITLNTYRG